MKDVDTRVEEEEEEAGAEVAVGQRAAAPAWVVGDARDRRRQGELGGGQGIRGRLEVPEVGTAALEDAPLSLVASQEVAEAVVGLDQEHRDGSVAAGTWEAAPPPASHSGSP